MPDGSDVSISVEGDRATVKWPQQIYSSNSPANDFPEIEGGETDVVVSVAQADLRALIDQVGFAMAQQDVRYFLNGMLFEVTEDHLRTVATDGHRLAMCTKGCTLESPIAARRQAIVPRKAVLELSRLLDEGQGHSYPAGFKPPKGHQGPVHVDDKTR